MDVTAPLTAERLAEWRRLAAAATPGLWLPKQHWTAEEMDYLDEPPADGAWWVDHPGWIDNDDDGLYFGKADALFVTAAREAVPELVDRVEALEAQVATLAGLLRDAVGPPKGRCVTCRIGRYCCDSCLVALNYLATLGGGEAEAGVEGT